MRKSKKKLSKCVNKPLNLCWGCILNICPPDKEINLDDGCPNFKSEDEYIIIKKSSKPTQAPKESQDNNIRIIKPKSLDVERKKIGVRQLSFQKRKNNDG